MKEKEFKAENLHIYKYKFKSTNLQVHIYKQSSTIKQQKVHFSITVVLDNQNIAKKTICKTFSGYFSTFSFVKQKLYFF